MVPSICQRSTNAVMPWHWRLPKFDRWWRLLLQNKCRIFILAQWDGGKQRVLSILDTQMLPLFHGFVLSHIYIGVTHSCLDVKREGSGTSCPSCYQWKSKPHLLLLYTRDRSTETRGCACCAEGQWESTKGSIARLTATHKACPRWLSGYGARSPWDWQ